MDTLHPRLSPRSDEATDCIIATCASLPGLDPDDWTLARALKAVGVHVTAAVWNDPAVDWARAHVCVIRSTWDYHKDPTSFVQWVSAASASTHLLNPADVIRWNSHKFYLRDLENHGIPVVPTVWLERGGPVELNELLDGEAWLEAVIKPAYGASADGC